MKRWIPGSVRRAAGRVRAHGVHAGVTAELRRLARSDEPIVAGPWLGEVGFEILYWIPFLRWALGRFCIAPDRVVAVSRGGVENWYRRVAARYCDVFDYFTLDEFRRRNEARRAQVGEQKQVRVTELDRDITEAVRGTIGAPNAVALHPSLMFHLMQPYWWKHAPAAWVDRHARFESLESPPAGPLAASLPAEYIAAKFYFNECFPATAANRAFAVTLTAALSAWLPVVLLETGLQIDEHEGQDRASAGRVTTIAGMVAPRDNMAVQTSVVAHARAFVGTYGGFSYLAPFYGVPSFGFYSNGGGFDRAHLRKAQDAFRAIGVQPLQVLDASTIGPAAVRALLEQLA